MITIKKLISTNTIINHQPYSDVASCPNSVFYKERKPEALRGAGTPPLASLPLERFRALTFYDSGLMKGCRAVISQHVPHFGRVTIPHGWIWVTHSAPSAVPRSDGASFSTDSVPRASQSISCVPDRGNFGHWGR